jgi:hypothetical protein
VVDPVPIAFIQFADAASVSLAVLQLLACGNDAVFCNLSAEGGLLDGAHHELLPAGKALGRLGG